MYLQQTCSQGQTLMNQTGPPLGEGRVPLQILSNISHNQFEGLKYIANNDRDTYLINTLNSMICIKVHHGGGGGRKRERVRGKERYQFTTYLSNLRPTLSSPMR